MENKKKISIAATGHRPNKLKNAYELTHPFAVEIMAKIKEQLISMTCDISEDGIITPLYDEIECISGGALGMDTYFAVVVLELKKEFPQFKLIMAIPCIGHGTNWPQSSKTLYGKLINECDENVLVTEAPFKPYLMQVRNEYMVNRANEIVSLWDGTSGGTKNCIDYALKQNKKITNLSPVDLTWSALTVESKPEKSEDDSQLSLF